jgi:hypothetical protein
MAASLADIQPANAAAAALLKQRHLEANRLAEQSVSVIAELFLALGRGDPEHWQLRAERYLAGCSLPDLAALQFLSIQIEDRVGDVRPVPRRLRVSRQQWADTPEPARWRLLVTRLGHSETLLPADQSDSTIWKWLRELEELARDELMYRTGVDDRPARIPVGWTDAHRTGFVPVSTAHADRVPAGAEARAIPRAMNGPAFGSWLRTKRSEMGLTLEELSSRSSVSVAAIWIIEAGNVRHPRSGTRKKLIAALRDT